MKEFHHKWFHSKVESKYKDISNAWLLWTVSCSLNHFNCDSRVYHIPQAKGNWCSKILYIYMVSYCHELKFLVRALRKYLPRIYINTQLKCCASNHSWKVGNTLFDFWLTTSLGLFESIKGVGAHKDTASGFHWLRMGIDKPFKTWNTTWRSRYVYIWVCVCVCVICINEMQMICLFFFTSFSLSVASFFVKPPLLKSCRLPRPLQPDEMSK